jgi:Sec-independent protein translocase protein TatA
MIEISWGESFVLFAIGVTAIGRKDLPKAAGFLGTKVGRVVGFLQGCRAQADAFAQNNELHALQNELRSGMRELDAVKGELALAASSQGMIGRSFGRSQKPKSVISTITPQRVSNSFPASSNFVNSTKENRFSIPTGSQYLNAAKEMSDHTQSIPPSQLKLAPRSQSVAAVAEEEWVKRGISFKSQAENGTGQYASMGSTQKSGSSNLGGGSALLSELIQQNLIHDQYERAVMEQDEFIHSRIRKSRQTTIDKKLQ